MGSEGGLQFCVGRSRTRAQVDVSSAVDALLSGRGWYSGGYSRLMHVDSIDD